MPQRLREALGGILLIGACALPGEAAAYMIVPGDEDPHRIVVEIDRDFGDRVPLRVLPPPYRNIVQSVQGPERLSFRWQYFRSSEQGLFYIHVGEDGSGQARFEFAGPRLADGDTLGAAAVLLDAAGRPMHTFLAKADVEGEAFAGGSRFHRVALGLERPPEWWRAVDSVVFLNMKYYRQQRPEGEAVWAAMERAVRHAAGGLGTSQRGDD
jgi:hypothetical protein